jgi:hypothetical protein
MKTALYKVIDSTLWTDRNETFWTLKNVVISGSYTMLWSMTVCILLELQNNVSDNN